MNRLAALVAICLVTPVLGSPPPFEVVTHTNLSYNAAKDADPVRHQLDLYLPKGAKEFPVMMFVHGGSWKSGNKELYAALGTTFAKQGIGTAIINYRLTSTDNRIKHPDHIHDVAKAFAWLKENAGKYGWDKSRLFACGHSAGGHLVALLATDEKYLKAEKCELKDIRGVLGLSGVYVVEPVIPLVHLVFGKDPTACSKASPINHVSANHPPFLLAYGDKDFRSLDKMAEDFGKKLKSAKCEARVMKFEKRDHFTIIINAAASSSDPLAKAMFDFMLPPK